MLVFRKQTHTNQYLNFESAHPLHQKLGVIRTLFDRCDRLVTDEADKASERTNIEKALRSCGYPKWSFDKVKRQMEKRHEVIRDKEKKDDKKGLVVLPYVKGTTETLSRVFRKYNIQTAMKPHLSIKNILVHPKDKIEDACKCGVVYEIPCLNCTDTYIGETGRPLNVRIKEHREDVEKNAAFIGTRQRRKQSVSEFNKSAVTDHVNVKNHVIDWENIRVKDCESNYKKRVIKEAITIRKTPSNMNRDQGNFILSHAYDRLLAIDGGTTTPPLPCTTRHLSAHPSHSSL